MFVAPPGRLVAVAKRARRSSWVSVVSGGEDRAWQAVQQARRLFGSSPAAHRDVSSPDKRLRSHVRNRRRRRRRGRGGVRGVSARGSGTGRHGAGLAAAAERGRDEDRADRSAGLRAPAHSPAQQQLNGHGDNFMDRTNCSGNLRVPRQRPPKSLAGGSPISAQADGPRARLRLRASGFGGSGLMAYWQHVEHVCEYFTMNARLTGPRPLRASVSL